MRNLAGARVSGYGPVPCSIALVGERPALWEARLRKPFVGPSGQELDRYLLTESGIDRSTVYVTNLVKTYEESPPNQDEVDRDLPELLTELNQCQPEFIGLVGAHAARAFLGDVEMEWSHGLVFPFPGFSMMPLIHPAAGLHQSSMQSRIANDFREFGKLVRGELLPTGHLRDSYPTVLYRQVDADTKLDCAAVDTEGTVEHPWGLSYSVSPACAVVQRDRKFRVGMAILHNALHDLPVLSAMGYSIDNFTDTMIMASLLGEPQSLKTLARRHCGMKMQEYSDVIRDAKREKALEYLSRVVDWITLG